MTVAKTNVGDAEREKVAQVQSWFEQRVSLNGSPYTLDRDQAKAVLDNHKNTLVTARAGSGKTRVIVAKVAYLVAQGLADLDEIAVFMFNRTAAAEVNDRIGAVEVNGVPLKHWHGRTKEIKIASTFHKFALDSVKASGERPELISELDRDQIIKQSVRQILDEHHHKTSVQEYLELLRLISSFITRAGQQYSGENGLSDLCRDVDHYIETHQGDNNYNHNIFLHRLALATYEDYLLALNAPKLDFNVLMSRAARILRSPNLNLARQRAARFKYVLVDEYQDFSYLFFSMIQAIRDNCPSAHLFCVGDDWQAINRFAGSDVNYFLKFATYFPEDVINIPLMTNYRSDRKIVENANKYMLKNYNPKAKKAIPFSKSSGKIKCYNYTQTKFDKNDLREDGLGDARYLYAFAQVCGGNPTKYTAIAPLLKTVIKIIKKHRRDEILLLHRHNFTSFAGVTLENFYETARTYCGSQNILSDTDFTHHVRCLTMHKSKGLESDVVILLEADQDQLFATHPHAAIFELFGDTLKAERADQHRLLYVALTRAKHNLYLRHKDRKSAI